jgi:hypothetical protein
MGNIKAGRYVRFFIKTLHHGEFYSMAEEMPDGVDVEAIASQLTDKIANVSSFSLRNGKPGGGAEEEYVILPIETLQTALITVQVMRIE